MFQKYLEDTALNIKIEEHIEFNQKALSIDYNTQLKEWTIVTKTKTYTANHLVVASGYFNLSRPFTPQIQGAKSFEGEVLHTQTWTEGYIPCNKTIVVIGNGASAMSLIPDLITSKNKIIMLQRRAGYYRQEKESRLYLLSKKLHKVTDSTSLLTLSRWLAIIFADVHFLFSYLFPKLSRMIHLKGVKKELGEVSSLFNPPYTPWQNRVLYTPDFLSLYVKKSFEIKNSSIDFISKNSISLSSGEVIDTDIIVMATGFEPEFCGGCHISINDEPYDLTKSKSGAVMLSGLPNLFMLSGYYHQSYLFKIEWQSKYIVNLLKFMKLNKKEEIQLNMQFFKPVKETSDPNNFVKQTYLKRGRKDIKNPMFNLILKGPLRASYGLAILDNILIKFKSKYYLFK